MSKRKSTKKTYRIVWKSKVTGLCGAGKPQPDASYEEMLRAARSANTACPDIRHWVEEVNG